MEFTIGELAGRAGVNVQTIRYVTMSAGGSFIPPAGRPRGTGFTTKNP